MFKKIFIYKSSDDILVSETCLETTIRGFPSLLSKHPNSKFSARPSLIVVVFLNPVVSLILIRSMLLRNQVRFLQQCSVSGSR